MDQSIITAREWVHHGTALCRQGIDALSDRDFAEPSMLPGWTRAHVIAHISLNARAHLNLVRWASTGIETPMYISMEQRAADIERDSQLSPAALRQEFHDSALAWEQGFNAVVDTAWDAQVKSAQGLPMKLSMVPWLRSREVMIHALDLGSTITWADIPDEYSALLIDNIVKDRDRRSEGRALVLDDGTKRWSISGQGDPLHVTGTTAAIAAYVSGREGPGVQVTDGDVPPLSSWL